jgi:hypothetical protein
MNNLIRLVIVANSISFFIIITMLEMLQLVFTSIYGTYQRNRPLRPDQKRLTQAQIIYNSNLIVSNVQMLVVLIAVCTFGVTFGVIQAAMDPENHKCSFAIMFSLAKEIKRSEPIGFGLGLCFAVLIEYLRQ